MGQYLVQEAVVGEGLRLTASGYEAENRGEECLRFGRTGQRNPPSSRLFRGDLAGLPGSINGALVELLVDGKPGRAGQAKGMRNHSHVTQTGPLEQPEEHRSNVLSGKSIC